MSQIGRAANIKRSIRRRHSNISEYESEKRTYMLEEKAGTDYAKHYSPSGNILRTRNYKISIGVQSKTKNIGTINTVLPKQGWRVDRTRAKLAWWEKYFAEVLNDEEYPNTADITIWIQALRCSQRTRK